MKTVIKYFLMLFLITTCYSQKQVNIIGKWINKSNNFISAIEFKLDNTAILYSENNIASEPFNLKIDYSKNPIWLDMKIVKGGITSEVFGLLSIIDEFSVKFELYLNPNENRPTSFSKDNNDDIINFILIKTK